MGDLITYSCMGYTGEVLRYLASPGVDVDVRDRKGATPLFHAASRGHQEVCQILLQHGADPNARTNWKATPLHGACERGQLNCVKILIKAGAHINAQTERKDTPLHLAAYRGYVDVIVLLIACRADPFLKNTANKNATQTAQCQGYTNAAAKLDAYVQGLGPGRHSSLPSLPTSVVGSSLDCDGVAPAITRPVVWTAPSLRQPCESSDEPINPTSILPKRNLHRDGLPPACTRSSAPPSLNDLSRVELAMTRRNEYGLSDLSFSSQDYASSTSCSSNISCNNTVDSWEDVAYCDTKESELSLANSLAGQACSRLPPSPSVNDSRTKTGVHGKTDILSYAENLQIEVLRSHQAMEELERDKSRLSQEKEYLRTLVVALQRHISNMELKQKNRVDCGQQRVQYSHAQPHSSPYYTAPMAMQQNTPACHFGTDLQNCILAERGGWSSDDPPQLDACLSRCEGPSLTSRIFSTGSGSSRAACCSGSASNDSATNSPELMHSPSRNGTSTGTMSDSPKREPHLKELLQTLQDQWLPRTPPEVLDTGMKEWRLNQDFIIVGDRPFIYNLAGKQEGCCSVLFRIRRDADLKEYLMKMKINLINTNQMSQESQNKLGAKLQKNFATEYHAPLLLVAHPNIAPVLHYYEASTELFQAFQPFLLPPSPHFVVEIPSQSSFLLMKEYPFSLRSFLEDQQRKHPEAPHGLTASFLLQLLFQLLAAVHHVRDNHLTHRNIKGENIFMDFRLRPHLGDFGYACRLHDHEGHQVLFTSREEVCAVNSLAWAPELRRLQLSGIEEADMPRTLESAYCKADTYAVGRMLYSLLDPAGEPSFPIPSQAQPYCSDRDMPLLPEAFPEAFRQILRLLVRDDPKKRPSAFSTMLSVGMLLFGPTSGEVQCVEDVEPFLRARSLKLLAKRKEERPGLAAVTQLSPDESVRVNQLELEALFLLHASPPAFWQAFEAVSNLMLGT